MPAAEWHAKKKNYNGNENSQTLRNSTTTTTTTTTTSPPYPPLPRHSPDQKQIESAPQTLLQGQQSSAARAKGINAPRPRKPVRDLFLDAPSSSSPPLIQRERSNSNGLSWSPRHARNTVVDDMLLSLDNIGTEPASSTSYDIVCYSPVKSRDIPGPSVQPRRLSLSSISSSEFSNNHDLSPPQILRHRTASGTNLKNFLATSTRLRVTSEEGAATSAYSASSIQNHSAPRSSSSSSFDLDRQTPKLRIHKNSESPDLSFIRMIAKANPQDLLWNDPDAAQSSVPATPRTPATSPSAPVVNGNSISANVRRRGSNLSPSRPVLLPNNQSSNMQDATSAESNSLATTTEKSTPTVGNVPSSLSKENHQRPGFFRRMFGSSGGPSQKEEILQHKRIVQKTSGTTAMHNTTQIDDTADLRQLQSQPRTPVKEKPAKDLQQQLNKKSSFFRRRRKSIQETPVPQLPQMGPERRDSTTGKDDPEVPGTPGSLQQAMDQYYATHRRIDSRGSIATSRRKNSLPLSDLHPTIRAIGGPSAANNAVTVLQAVPSADTSRTSIEPAARVAKDTDNKEHRKSMSSGGKLESRDTSKAVPAEKPRPNSAHRRNQSDIDKNLPRLPVDYSSVKSPSTQDVPTSKYNSTASKNATRDAPSSRGSLAPSSQTPSKKLSADDMKINGSPRQGGGEDSRPASRSKTTTSANTRATPTEDAAVEHEDLADETKEAMMFLVHDTDGPTQEQKTSAQKLFDGTFGIDRSETAPWLGEADPERSNVRLAYMELFDWKDMSILGALRSFCNHIQVKGETQQVDRLLDALSRRWCDCNPKHGFKATDVVHTICYSVLLLNTDLHMADIESKMTRNQFIKNTMPTIRRVVIDAAPNAFESNRTSMLPPIRKQPEPTAGNSGLSNETSQDSDGRPVHRLQTRPSDHSAYDVSYDNEDCGPLVKSSYFGRIGGWEALIEVVLKNFYISIRNQRLPLFSGEEEKRADSQQLHQGPVASMGGGILRRTNSLLSKAGSETLPIRGRISDTRLGSRWSTKGRSKPRLYPASLAHSRTSIDDDQSAISPSMSSMWSRHSLGKTSMSMTSLASAYPNAEYQRSIGFANALSQAITRSDSADESAEDLLRIGPLLEDESLELEGAPWAKEGILKHKHHLESVDKKAKDRNWTECFAVIEKGWIRLFQFNMNSKSVRQRSQRMAGGGAVGGGNWMDSAESLGQFLLRHTIASALPPPGYSKARPHVWALSLPTGAVHLFQAGTPEIVKEFVSTANYWSARLSKEPLIGGVSNVEYGWGERVINLALVDGSRPSSTVTGQRPSMSQSIRTSLDQASVRAKLPGDKIVISDWSPPTQSMMASQLLEVDQLRALQVYVQNIEEELRKHNELRSAMLLAFTPRSANHARAMSNWERKSSYLLREIVKFSTYLESLQHAGKEMERVKAEREVREEDKKQLQQQADAEEDVTS